MNKLTETFHQLIDVNEQNVTISLILCSGSYTVTPIESGLQINVMNFTPGDYKISIIEGGRRVIEETVIINHSGQHNIQHLKPCTEYEHQVTFIHSDGNKTLQCTSTGNKTKTKEMSEYK